MTTNLTFHDTGVEIEGSKTYFIPFQHVTAISYNKKAKEITIYNYDEVHTCYVSNPEGQYKKLQFCLHNVFKARYPSLFTNEKAM